MFPYSPLHVTEQGSSFLIMKTTYYNKFSTQGLLNRFFPHFQLHLVFFLSRQDLHSLNSDRSNFHTVV